MGFILVPDRGHTGHGIAMMRDRTVGEIRFALGDRQVHAALDEHMRWCRCDRDVEAFLSEVCSWEPTEEGNAEFALHSLYQMGHRLGAVVARDR